MFYKCWVLAIYFLRIINVFNYYSCTFSGLSLLGFTTSGVLTRFLVLGTWGQKKPSIVRPEIVRVGRTDHMMLGIKLLNNISCI